jgi:hypothetical protein
MYTRALILVAALLGGVACGAHSCPPNNPYCAPGPAPGPGPAPTPQPGPTPAPVLSTARLATFLCPDFNTGPCYQNSHVFILNGQCLPLVNWIDDACYNTGFTVEAGRNYELQACAGCNGPCGSPVTFTTPLAFDGPTYDPGDVFFCEYSCSRPAVCY